MKPFASFLVIHFEVGSDTWSLEYQEALWPAAIDLIALADQYKAKLTLQFNPQWVEYTLKDDNKLGLLRQWQKQGHEVGLHHHGYDHGDWNGYTNRSGKEDDPKFRGRLEDLMKLMRRLVDSYQLLSGTITDEEFDYPEGIRYDTEGIQLGHARSRPKLVTLGGKEVIQVGMAFLFFEGHVENFKGEYLKSGKNEIFGVVTHEKDFSNNPAIVEEWLRFIQSNGERIKALSEIITDYQKVHAIKQSDNPLTFSKNVLGVTVPSVIKEAGAKGHEWQCGRFTIRIIDNG